MRVRRWKMHVIARCTDCDWECEDYQTGRRAAAQHAKSTGHHVFVEEGFCIEYNGQDAESTDA